MVTPVAPRAIFRVANCVSKEAMDARISSALMGMLVVLDILEL
jgi:hypothetical protein